MKPVLLIIAQLNFQPIEYRDTRDELEKSGFDVIVASISNEVAVGKDGTEVQPDIAVDDVSADNYSAVAVIGGPGATVLAKYESVLNLLQDFSKKGKVVAGICIAPTVLAASGVLKGKKATVWNGDQLQDQVLKKYGANYVPEHVVVDGKMVTADGPMASRDFGKAIAKLLKSKEG